MTLFQRVQPQPLSDFDFKSLYINQYSLHLNKNICHATFCIALPINNILNQQQR